MSDVTIMENVTENEVAQAIGDAIVTEGQPSMDLADVPMTDPVQDLKDISYQSGYTDGYSDSATKYQAIVKSSKVSNTLTGMVIGVGITVGGILVTGIIKRNRLKKKIEAEFAAKDDAEVFEGEVED